MKITKMINELNVMNLKKCCSFPVSDEEMGAPDGQSEEVESGNVYK